MKVQTVGALLLLMVAACANPTTDGGGQTSAPPPPSSVASDAAAPKPTPPEPTNQRFAALNMFLDQQLADGLHGFAMQVFDRDDNLVFKREAGTCATRGPCPAGEPPFTTELVTGIASSSKWVTSTTVLAELEALVADGKVKDLATALDTAVVPKLGCQEVSGPVTTITMRQLLSFTSGVLPDHACVSDRTATLKTCACAILKDSAAAMTTTAGDLKNTAHPPGTTYKYGGSHHVIAGAALESVSGQTYRAIYDARVKKPLGLTMDYASETNLAGSIRGSVADYSKFVAAIFHDGIDGKKRILSTAGVLEQRKSQVPSSAVILLSPRDDDAGYGFNIWRMCWQPFTLENALATTLTVTTDPSCSAVFQIGHGGKGGYWPFLDANTNSYYAVFAMREESGNSDTDYSPAERDVTRRVSLLTHLAMSTP